MKARLLLMIALFASALPSAIAAPGIDSSIQGNPTNPDPSQAALDTSAADPSEPQSPNNQTPPSSAPDQSQNTTAATTGQQANQPNEDENTPSETVSANTLPDECQSLATSKRYLIAGPLNASYVGARLWNIAKIARANPQSQGEKDCTDKISNQAYQDESTYWKYIGEKYHCLDEKDELPSPRPDACPEAKYESVASSLDTLKLYDSAQQQTSYTNPDGSPCTPPQQASVSPHAVHLAKEVADINSHVDQSSPREPAQEFNSGVYPPELWEPARQLSSCQLAVTDQNGNVDESKLKPEYWSADYKSKHKNDKASGAGVDLEKCGLGLLKGVGGNFKDLLTGLWATLKGILHLPMTIAHLCETLFKTGIGTLARQALFERKAMWKHFTDLVEKATKILADKAVNEWQELSCYNPAAKSEKICSMIGYVGTDVVLLPLMGDLGIKAISKFPKVLEFYNRFVKPAVEFPGKMVKGAVTFVPKLIFKALGGAIKIADSVASKWKWYRDLASGLKVALVGDTVMTRGADGLIRPVITKSIKERFIASLERTFGPPNSYASKEQKNVVRAFATSLAQKTLSNPVTRWSWKKFGPSEAKALKALEANAEIAAKETSTLPAKMAADQNLTSLRLEDVSAELRPAYIKATEEEAAESSKFLGLERDTGTGAEGGEFLAKDLHGNKLQLYHVQDDANDWEYTSYLRKDLDLNQKYFTVSVPIHPNSLAEALPTVLDRAKKLGSDYIEIGASKKTLESGNRLVVSFADAQKAKTFSERVEHLAHSRGWMDGSNVDRVGVVKKGKKILQRGIIDVAITRCKAGEDPRCYCKVFLQQGLNPETNEPIEISPFNCATEAEQKAAIDQALKTLQSEAPSTPARLPAGMKAPIKHSIDIE